MSPSRIFYINQSGVTFKKSDQLKTHANRQKFLHAGIQDISTMINNDLNLSEVKWIVDKVTRSEVYEVTAG